MNKKKVLTIQEINQEIALVLLEFTAPPSKYAYTTREASGIVEHIICSDGIELGRLIPIPGTHRVPSPSIKVVSTAIERGVEASWREYGTVTDLPSEECERHQELIAIFKRIQGTIEFRYGLGEWAEAWERLEQKISVKDGAGKVGRLPLTEKEREERAKIVKKILEQKSKLGINLEQACAREGIPYSTFRDWRRKYAE